MAYDVTDFEEEVIKRSSEVPVLVDFWAEWCGPCKILSPVLERLAAANKGEWELAKVDTEEFPEIAMEYGVQGIPNVKLFFQGNVTAEFVGAIPEHAVKQWLQKNIPSSHQTGLDHAATLIAEGNEEEGARLLREILDAEPDNQRAKILLARAMLFREPSTSAQLVRQVDDPSQGELTDALSTMLRMIEIAGHPEKLPESPIRPHYLAAIEHVRHRRFEQALEAFIDIIRRDRFYDDDGSRKACIALFKFLGEDHPVTQQYRREFSRALYV